MFKIIWRKRRIIRRPRRGTRVSYLKYKEAARELVKSRLEYYMRSIFSSPLVSKNASSFTDFTLLENNKLYQFKIGRVSIKNHKSRWGSCSKKGNLNFNYKLALLPQELADYVIVHELCHLGEFNHSPKFWKLVARAIPNYKALKKKFKGLII
mgnify:CR=1 FL=1